MGDGVPDIPSANLELNGRYQHFTPALQITTRSGVIVRSGREITQRDNPNFSNSNSTDPLFNRDAHGWYINEISACGDVFVSNVVQMNLPLIQNQVAELVRTFGRANPGTALLLRLLLAALGVFPPLLDRVAPAP
jgi:hypothetical protein